MAYRKGALASVRAGVAISESCIDAEALVRKGGYLGLDTHVRIHSVRLIHDHMYYLSAGHEQQPC